MNYKEFAISVMACRKILHSCRVLKEEKEARTRPPFWVFSRLWISGAHIIPERVQIWYFSSRILATSAELMPSIAKVKIPQLLGIE